MTDHEQTEIWRTDYSVLKTRTAINAELAEIEGRLEVSTTEKRPDHRSAVRLRNRRHILRAKLARHVNTDLFDYLL